MYGRKLVQYRRCVSQSLTLAKKEIFYEEFISKSEISDYIYSKD
jgi:hypothetical protein